MKINDIILEKAAAKPRNFVAKNAGKTTSGAGKHKDRKKAAKQGDVKHKGKVMAEGSEDDIEDTRQWRDAIALAKSQKAIRQARYGKDQKFYADGTPVTPEEVARRAAERKAKKKGVAEGISVVDQDYDLDQIILTLDIEGRRVSFTYTDYDENFENAERRDVFDQLQEKSWYKGLDHPTKMEILDAAYKAIRGEEPSEYKPRVDDEPLDIDEGVSEGSDWGEPREILKDVLQTLEREVEWPLTEVMDPREVRQLLAPIIKAVNDKMMSMKEAQDDWGGMSHREFKRKELQHELGHEDDPEFQRQMREKDRGPWYIKIDGRIYKQKGQPKAFDWKKGANNYALAMVKNQPALKSKILLTKNLSDDVAETATTGSMSSGDFSVGAVYPNKKGKTYKNKDGTTKNALDIKGGNLLTGGSIAKR
jgi:hypothetical protein